MKLLTRKKLPSGAMQFIVFVSVLVALLLAALLLLTYTHKHFIEQSRNAINTISLGNSGIRMLIKAENLQTNDTVAQALPDDLLGQSLSTNLSTWGIFEKAYAKATLKKKEFRTVALLGTGIPTKERAALYLAEHFIPLAVVGTTRIEGKAILPQQGVRPGNIRGIGYYGKELIFGQTTVSSDSLPKLKYDYKVIAGSYLTIEYESNFRLEKNKKITISFLKPTAYYMSPGKIVLEDISITGNVLIHSDTEIVVRKTAALHDIIIVAPKVVLEDGVKGNFQVFADTSIVVGNGCSLNYPSALILLQKEKSPASPGTDMLYASNDFTNQIYIGKGSSVKGTALFLSSGPEERNYRPHIILDENSKFGGEIYCAGNLELKACIIAGSVYANYLVANEGGTIFVNHIMNATLQSEKLPESYGGLLFANSDKTVMKWLY